MKQKKINKKLVQLDFGIFGYSSLDLGIQNVQ